MAKKKSEMIDRIKAGNPHLSDAQVDELLKESFYGEDAAAGGDGEDEGACEKAADSEVCESLKTEGGDLKAELEAERLKLLKEKEALESERLEFLKEKEALNKSLLKVNAGSADAVLKKDCAYVCNTACTFDGKYFRKGDVLFTSKEVTDFFDVVS